MILVDSSVLIDFFKGRKSKGALKLKKIIVQGIPFGITSFIYQEVLQGAKNEKEFDELKDYLSTQLFYEPKDSIKSYEAAAKIYYTLRRDGKTVRSTIDCLIAQIVKENNLVLLHNDKDFDTLATFLDFQVY